MAKRTMHELHLKRIAAVDRPCQEGATVAIMKRASAGPYFAKAKDDPALPDAVEAYLKRDFSGDKRKELASTGAALPDGSFPIETRGDVKNAVQAFGRAKNRAKAKAHIITRARSLDATSLLPAEWKVSKMDLLVNVTNDEAMEGFAGPIEVFLGEMGAVDFDSIQAEAEAREYANGLLCEIDEAVCSLREVFWEIGEDKAIADKQEALQESLEQFKAHIQGIIPEGLENAMVAAALEEAGFEITEGGALTKRETDMGYSIELKKSLGLPVTANDADVTKALDLQAKAAKRADAILKMSGKHSAFMANEKAKMPDGGKEAFADMSADERDKHMEKNPIEKTATEKAADDKALKEKEDKEKAEKLAKAAGEESITVDGTVVLKSAVGEATFAVLKSQQAAIEKAADAAAITVIEKRASTELVHIGKADELATMLHGIAKVSPKLSEQVEAVLKAAEAKIAKGGLFSEAGSSSTGTSVGKAVDQIETLAQAMVTKGEAKNIFKARDAVRKSQPDLAKLEAEERKKAA